MLQLLSELLDDNGVGTNIQTFYNQNAKLKDQHKKMLVELIFQQFYAANGTAMPLATIKWYSEQIQNIFPTENKVIINYNIFRIIIILINVFLCFFLMFFS